MSSSRGNQMFSDDERFLNDTSYSYDCFSFLRATISSMMRFCPSTTTVAPSFIFFSSSSVIWRVALLISSMSSPVW